MVRIIATVTAINISIEHPLCGNFYIASRWVRNAIGSSNFVGHYFSPPTLKKIFVVFLRKYVSWKLFRWLGFELQGYTNQFHAELMRRSWDYPPPLRVFVGVCTKRKSFMFIYLCMHVLTHMCVNIQKVFIFLGYEHIHTRFQSMN